MRVHRTSELESEAREQVAGSGFSCLYVVCEVCSTGLVCKSATPPRRCHGALARAIYWVDCQSTSGALIWVIAWIRDAQATAVLVLESEPPARTKPAAFDCARYLPVPAHL